METTEFKDLSSMVQEELDQFGANTDSDGIRRSKRLAVRAITATEDVTRLSVHKIKTSNEVTFHKNLSEKKLI